MDFWHSPPHVKASVGGVLTLAGKVCEQYFKAGRHTDAKLGPNTVDLQNTRRHQWHMVAFIYMLYILFLYLAETIAG